MASIDVEIGSRRYSIACRDGEEEHLRSVAAVVDQKAREAGKALGSLSEARQLLFASLLLADALNEKKTSAETSPSEAATNPVLAETLERLAERVERLADRLEGGVRSPYIES